MIQQVKVPVGGRLSRQTITSVSPWDSTTSNPESFNESKLFQLKVLRGKAVRSPAEHTILKQLEVEKFNFIASRALEECEKLYGCKLCSIHQVEVFTREERLQFNILIHKRSLWFRLTPEEIRLLNHYGKTWTLRMCALAKLDSRYWPEEKEEEARQNVSEAGGLDNSGADDVQGLCEPRLPGAQLPNGALLHLRGREGV